MTLLMNFYYITLQMFNVIIVGFLSFFISYISIPIIIGRVYKFKILDDPGGRKIHKAPTPSFGGIAIFIGMFLSSVFIFIENQEPKLFYILISCIVVLITGLRDDRYNITPKQKLLGQIIAIFIVINNIPEARITHIPFPGLGNVELFKIASYFISTIVYIVLINSVNLIDGVDGLCGSICILIFSYIGYMFYINIDDKPYLFMTLIGCIGSTIGFLIYNYSPARIFMGDTGSLVLGFIATMMTIIIYNEIGINLEKDTENVESPILMVFCILVIPIYDTARVSVLRLLNGINPTKPDKRHMHFFLQRLGLSATQTTISFILFNLYVITLFHIIDPLGDTIGLIIVILHFFAIEKILRIAFKRKKTNDT